jgi:hypothetical protein
LRMHLLPYNDLSRFDLNSSCSRVMAGLPRC